MKQVNTLLEIEEEEESASGSAGCPKDPLMFSGNPMGDFGGDDEATPTGVCELPNGDYIETEHLTCDGMNGDYKGDGTKVKDYVTGHQTMTYPASGVTSLVSHGLFARDAHSPVTSEKEMGHNSVDNTVYRDPATDNPVPSELSHVSRSAHPSILALLETRVIP